MRFFAALSLLAASGCALTAPSTLPSGSPTAGPFLLTHATTGPEVDALAATFYGGHASPSELAPQLAAALARYPDNSTVHEVAAYAAILGANPHEAWYHFMKAACDLDAPLPELYLWELTWDQTAGESSASAQLLREIRAHHPNSDARAFATDLLARQRRRMGELEEARGLSRSLGFVENWALLGPFPNDQGKGFITEYPPENRPDTVAERAAAQPGILIPVQWRTVDRVSDLGGIALDDLFAPHDSGVAYLLTYLHSDEARQVTLRLTTGDPTRVWCNGGLVLSEELLSGGDLDTVRIPIALARGWNRILVKSAHRRGGWAVKARFTDEAGAPAAGLSFSSEPHEVAIVAATPVALSGRSPSLAKIAPAPRRLLVTSRLDMRGGWERKALGPLQELLALAPRNPIANYYAALAYWDNDELGRAIDLLNQGASDGNHPAFRWKRAVYYLQKHLYDKAQRDLSAVLAAVPASRMAQMELADLLGHRGWVIDRCRVLKDTVDKWPDSGWAMRELGVCLGLAGYDEPGERVLGRARDLEPGNTVTLRALVDAALRRRDLTAARSILETLRTIQPTRADHVADAAEMARRGGDGATAATLFRQAAQMAPEWARPWRALGDLLHEANREAEAMAAWRQALELDPNDSSLAQRIEYLQPMGLGFVEKFVPTEEAIDRAVNAKVTPMAGAQVVMLLDDDVTEVKSDGSSRRVVTQVMQAVNEQGRDALIREHVPGGTSTKMLHAYSLSKNGEMQEASSIRGDEVRFRNLEVGSRVVIQYVRYEPAPRFLPGQYVAGWFFQSVARQHEASRWVVVLDGSRHFNVEIDGEVAREDTVEGPWQVHVFSAKHVPPIVAEPSMPPPPDLLRRVSVSTVENWDDYVRWERALLDDAFHTNPKLDALVTRLTDGAATPREKLDRLFHYATQDVRYQQDYENTIAGVRPHACPIVLERGYGDCKDKAVLLIQMARLAGLHLEFALLRTTHFGKLQRKVPNQQFNHAIVHVPAQPGIDAPFFMDPTSDGLDVGNLRSDDQGATSLVLDPQSGRSSFLEIPYQPPELQYEKSAIHVVVKSPTEAHASVAVTLRGGPAMRARHLLRDRGAAQKWLESAAPALFSGATLVGSATENETDIVQPVVLKLEIDVSNALQARDDRWQLPVPGSFVLDRLVSLPRRETPLQLDVPDTHGYHVEVELPEGFEPTHLPAQFSVDHACFSAHRTASAQGPVVTVDTDYQRRCTVVAPADYADFREAVQKVVRQFQDEIVFARKAAPPPGPVKGRKTRPGGP